MRAGYSGECSPRYKSNLILGLPVGHNATLKHTIFPLFPDVKRDNVDLLYGMKYIYSDNNNSKYDINFEAMEKLFEDISGSKALDVNFQDHPILLTEPNKIDSKYREKFTELMFESYNVYQMFLSKRSVLACYGCARTSGLVLSVEKNCTNLCGMQDGYIFQKHIEEVPIGGELLDRIYFAYLENIKNIQIYPSFCIDKSTNTEKKINEIKILKCPLVTKPYYLWGSLHVVSKIKEALFNDNQNVNDKKIKSNDPTNTNTANIINNDNNNNDDVYTLPDGNIIDKRTSNEMKLIFPTLDEVLNFLIVTGESTMFHNFVGLLKSYIPYIDTIKGKATKLIYSKGADRKYNTFIGASILSSLGSFPQFCMTKSEYEEHGAKNIIEKKCV